MGFGYLFLGYIFATIMSMNPFGFLIRPIGYAVVLLASCKLRRYHRDFGYLTLGSALMIVIALLLALSNDQIALLSAYQKLFGYVEMGGSLVFHASLLWSIRAIAKETDVLKISVSAIRNAIFLGLYYVLSIIAYLPFAFTKTYAIYFSAPVWFLYIACYVLNAILIFSCYMRICDEADVDMAQKPSRFAFVNRMRAESEARRQEKAAAYAQRAAERKERKEMRKKK